MGSHGAPRGGGRGRGHGCLGPRSYGAALYRPGQRRANASSSPEAAARVAPPLTAAQRCSHSGVAHLTAASSIALFAEQLLRPLNLPNSAARRSGRRSHRTCAVGQPRFGERPGRSWSWPRQQPRTRNLALTCFPKDQRLPFERLCEVQSISQLEMSVAPPFDHAVT